VVTAILVECRKSSATAGGSESFVIPIVISWGMTLVAWVVAGLLAPLASDNTPRRAAAPFDAESELT